MSNYIVYSKLLAEWKKVFGCEAGFAELMSYYDGAHDRLRSYHTADHIFTCINDFYAYFDVGVVADKLIQHPRTKPLDKRVVLASLFFHDAVYYIENTLNEIHSVELFKEMAEQYAKAWKPRIKPHFVRSVSRAILATSMKKPNVDGPLTTEEELVCDLDVLFLGKNHAAYTQMHAYEENIWNEYVTYKRDCGVRPVPLEYVQRRAQVLASLYQMAKDGTLFKTKPAIEMFTENAVNNLSFLTGVVSERARAIEDYDL